MKINNKQETGELKKQRNISSRRRGVTNSITRRYEQPTKIEAYRRGVLELK